MAVPRPPPSAPTLTLGAGVPVPGDTPPTFGRLVSVEEIGRGGMGVVWEAWDPELRRPIAVKVLLDTGDSSTARRARFLAEAQITSQLQHPNVVPVHDLGTLPDGRPFFVMRKIEGRSLRDVLDALRLGEPADTRYWTRRRLVNAFVQAGQAVAYAHQRGVIHRDLKPDNLMLGAFGEVLVVDWGLARPVAGPEPTPLAAPPAESTSERVRSGRVATGPLGPTHSTARPGTEFGVAMGTPGYMSPEQARGDLRVIDTRSDVWSLGAMLFEILTGRRAFVGASPHSVLHATQVEPPPDPRLRAPDRDIPDELAAICLRAMDRDPSRRYPSATELVEAVELWLDGSQRRALAAEKLAEGEAFWARCHELVQERARLSAEERALEESVEPWATGPQKDALIGLRDRREQMEIESSLAFARVVAMGERALSFDPGNPEARAFLARAYWWRYEEAEATNNTGALAFFADRVREYDDGRYTERLDGEGQLTLRTDPAGALVFCRRYEARGLAWPLSEPRVLGPTPLVARRLDPGSYQLTLRYPGRRDVLLPVHIGRGQHTEGAVVRLLSEGEIGPDNVYVPGGSSLVGGDPETSRQLDAARIEVGPFLMARYPVTARQYAAFLNDLHGRDPELARRRAPRREIGLAAAGAPYWRVPGPDERWEVPTTDADADPWHPDWPVFAVSWHDARAYAAWRSVREGVTWDLPREVEWERAARGADGRQFPWGNRFDPTAAKTEHSRRGRPQPEPVGTFALDSSPFGVRDLAGGVREWCGDPTFDDDPDRRPVRGGCWVGGERLARAANRFGFEPDVVHSYIGFRLIRRLPSEPR